MAAPMLRERAAPDAAGMASRYARTMSIAADIHPLLSSAVVATDVDGPNPLLDELRELAVRYDLCTLRSHQVFEQLRKMLGQERLTSCLCGVQFLAAADEPAGARLLAALLDANTPGHQLLPRVRRFRSVGRLMKVDAQLVGATFRREWQERLTDVVALAAMRVEPGRDDGRDEVVLPVNRPPLPLLRRALDAVTPGPGRADPDGADLQLLAALVRLECDAFQERVSRLAGEIDPFRVSAVMRALPLLNRADAEIRDMGRLALWLEAGDVEAAFRRRIPTMHEVLDAAERTRMMSGLRAADGLEPLVAVLDAFDAARLSVRQLAGPTSRVLALGRALQREGLRDTPLGLLDAVRIVLEHGRDGDFVLPLSDRLLEVVGRILVAGAPVGAEDLSGLEIRDGALVVLSPRLGLGDRIWRHDLPLLSEVPSVEAPAAVEEDGGSEDQADEKAPEEDRSASAVKQLVMNNMGCVSIVLGFLRNPKVTAIPGLVAEVARRTRSGRILEVIAQDRHLSAGHANKDVPLALIESPVNISIKTIRKFIHVKYISKTDLKRLSRDKSRLRKEVCDEINRYLDSLT